jgi:uncharacterized membrane protein
MTALSRIDQASGVAAMNSINTVILRSLCKDRRRALTRNQF